MNANPKMTFISRLMFDINSAIVITWRFFAEPLHFRETRAFQNCACLKKATILYYFFFLFILKTPADFSARNVWNLSIFCPNFQFDTKKTRRSKLVFQEDGRFHYLTHTSQFLQAGTIRKIIFISLNLQGDYNNFRYHSRLDESYVEMIIEHLESYKFMRHQDYVQVFYFLFHRNFSEFNANPKAYLHQKVSLQNLANLFKSGEGWLAKVLFVLISDINIFARKV